MFSTTAMARHPHAPLLDPYRVLFDHLSAGAARCRLIVEDGTVAGVEILESNAAFEPLRASLPQLFAMFSRVRDGGKPETLQLRVEEALLSASAYPAGDEHVMVVLEDATVRDRREQRSRELQDRFEQAFHGNAAAMVIAHRSDLRIIDVNPRWLAMFGANRAEVIGRTAVELGLITASRAQTWIAEHEQFTEGYDVELEFHTRAGASFTVLASAKPIDIAEGPCTLTTLIDITDRKHAEEAFAVAFSASPAGMMLVDAASDTVVAVNNRLLEMTQGRRDDLVGRQTNELALIVNPSRGELLREIERSGRLNGVEVELACNGGPGFWTLASTEMVTLHDKAHRLSVFTDITVRKRFERRLMTQHVVGRRLAETSELDAAIPHFLEALCRGEGWDCGAVWLPGADDHELLCCGTWRDPELGEELGPATPRIERSSSSLLGRVLATGAAEKVVLDAATGAHGVPAAAAGMRYAVAFPLLRGNAVLGVVAMAARHSDPVLDTAERGLFDSVGRLLGLFVERTRAEASLRELNAELERRVRERTHALETSNRDLEAFSSSVSHDLRAPLRAIYGFSEILIEDFAANLPEEAIDLLMRIRAGGVRLRKLIEDLLEFSRLGRGGLRPTHIELDPLVRSVCDELLVGRELGERLDLRVMPLGTCRADATLLRTVWTNLIDNALKYSQNRDRIVIEVGREVRGGEIIYYVSDNGSGFDMTHAERLFGVFQRLHSAADFEGTGIGLANIRRIIERHHGRVTATSVLGRGSRFEFTLGTELE
jgi:PAS domain S-box-containing protein